MSKSEIRNPKSEIFLGVDGGQSHTEAVIAGENGVILGRGLGGASNHAEVPGGRERLRNAIADSVGAALKSANLPPIDETVFSAAHCGMTGGADYKREIIGEIIKSDNLIVGHDAPTALYGATAGKPGIVVISGTGSVVYGENEAGETAQIGGLGFLFSDEGSGFWLAAQTIRLAIKERDGLIKNSGLENLVLNFFKVEEIRNLTTAFYNGKVSRDEIAALAKAAHEAAANGSELLQNQIRLGAEVLVESVKSAVNRLNFTEIFPVAGVGGMFRANLMNESFAEILSEKIPRAGFVKPLFSPAIGALLMAYRQAEIEITEQLLSNLENTQNR
jgi:glucosamine kinase